MSDAPTSPVNRTASTTTGFFRYLVIRRLPLVPVRFIKGVRVRARLPLLPRGLAHLLREAQLAEDCPALLTHGPPAATATEGGLRPELRLADVHQRRMEAPSRWNSSSKVACSVMAASSTRLP